MKRNEMMAMLLAGGQGSMTWYLTMDKAKPAVLLEASMNY